MNRIYFLAPLLGLIVFAGIHAWSQSGQQERIEARQIALKAEQEARLAAEREARRIAIAEAMQVQAQRKKERAERDVREAAEREARAAALDARDQAFREQDRLTRQMERLKREIATEQEAVNQLQSQFDAALAEQTYLKDFVPLARANAAELRRVLEQIAAAEAARLKQAAENSKK